MPNYDYRCLSCGHQAEIFHKITETIKACPQCHKETFQPGPGGGVGLSFKGNGFYITDYAKSGGSDIAANTCCPCGKNQSCSSS